MESARTLPDGLHGHLQVGKCRPSGPPWYDARMNYTNRVFGLAIVGVSGALLTLVAMSAPKKELQLQVLLVACTKYDHSSNQFRSLKGPANSLKDVNETLRKHSIPADVIRVLADDQPIAVGRPTNQSIRQEFDRLVEQSQEGQKILIWLCGHGSQTPDQAPFDEEDNRDEIFLPADAKLNPNSPTNPWMNIIRDDELNELAVKLSQRGATVWFVLDCCHSGDGLKAAPELGDQLPPELQAVPLEKFFLQEDLLPVGPLPKTRPQTLPSRCHVYYACQSREKTLSWTFDSKSRDQYHCMFTYALCRQWEKQSKWFQANDEKVIKDIQDQYGVWKRKSPTRTLIFGDSGGGDKRPYSEANP
jgi:hypothetical protein